MVKFIHFGNLIIASQNKINLTVDFLYNELNLVINYALHQSAYEEKVIELTEIALLETKYIPI